jgi:hypothetical protein
VSCSAQHSTGLRVPSTEYGAGRSSATATTQATEFLGEVCVNERG